MLTDSVANPGFLINDGLTTIEPGQEYIIRVQAKNSFGYGDLSDEVSVYAAKEPQPPVNVKLYLS